MKQIDVFVVSLVCRSKKAEPKRFLNGGYNMKKNLLAFLLITFSAISALSAIENPSPEQTAFFKKEVKPILEENCYRCHGGEDKLRGHFRVTSREGILKGGDQGISTVS